MKPEKNIRNTFKMNLGNTGKNIPNTFNMNLGR